jgi:hypothetical protein
MKVNGNHRGRRGQALAEMAVMVPFLVIGMMGFLDLGRALYFQIALTNAVREGARLASLPNYFGLAPDCSFGAGSANCPLPSDGAIITRVNQELTGTGFTIQAADITVTPNEAGRMTCYSNPVQCQAASPTQYAVTVSAKYKFTFITPMIASLFGGSITLQSAADMRTEY